MSDGTGCIIINPNSCFNPAGFVNNSNYLPFVSVASGSTSNPFAAVPAYSNTAFNSQALNTETFGLDALQMNFI